MLIAKDVKLFSNNKFVYGKQFQFYIIYIIVYMIVQSCNSLNIFFEAEFGDYVAANHKSYVKDYVLLPSVSPTFNEYGIHVYKTYNCKNQNNHTRAKYIP